MNIEPASIVTRNPDIMFSDLEDSIVMMNIDAGDYYDLDKIGAEVWKLLDQPLAVNVLCERLRENFDVDPETCIADVTDFLGEMQEMGLVTIG